LKRFPTLFSTLLPLWFSFGPIIVPIIARALKSNKGRNNRTKTGPKWKHRGKQIGTKASTIALLIFYYCFTYRYTDLLLIATAGLCFYTMVYDALKSPNLCWHLS